ncbi:hypothetical protein EON65_02250 [archaeon]|nr:MAG: hypothetical protein EON65_02250 [archaeon]
MQLKNRLHLKWNESRSLYSSSNLAPALVDTSLVKGFGETQFAESRYEIEPLHELDQASTGVWQQNTAILADIDRDKSTTEHFNRDTKMLPSLFDRSRTLASLADRGVHTGTFNATGASQFTKGGASKVSRRTHQSSADGLLTRQPPIPQSHLHVSQTLQTRGLESVAEHLVFGQTSFAYVDNTENDFYSFSVKSAVPATLTQSQYMTISEHGVLRATLNGDELTSLVTLQKERTLYQKLLCLNVFRSYRLWKPLLVWKKHIRRRKIAHAVR